MVHCELEALQDPRPYLDDFQVVAETARAAAHQVSTAAPSVAHGAVRATHVGAKAAKRTKWLWRPALWVMKPLRHAAARRLLGEQAPAGVSDAASTTTATSAGGGGLGGSPVLVAAEGLVQAVQPLLSTPHTSDTGSSRGGEEPRNRRGYRSDPDEPSADARAHRKAAAAAPAGAAEAGGGGGSGGIGTFVSGSVGSALGGAGAVLSGARKGVEAGVHAGVQAGKEIGHHLRPRSVEPHSAGADMEQGAAHAARAGSAGAQAARGSVFEGLKRDVQSVVGAIDERMGALQ
ncbi:hypothetical protein GPECTOR_23g35 [Gonium pectorale]|uniref:Uncharacterized protein n=1 Tax=Gonium pectorale TaxID=33097 RepID=A0A150GH11_GONPE|nr:hypothetical protein GPECTOR_23g35 [Gonium pectorale]|eukprot:KXZ49104.1 hypothetical protein GPECTOR_23g35 [Gonium pectorale]